MNNLKALRTLCNAIANTFYPDESTLELALMNESIDSAAEATAKDPAIFRAAAKLVQGYVESSRTEGNISTSVREDAIEKSLRVWCNYYGLSAEEELSDTLRVIEDGSSMW